jgi:hypothetical protein
VRVSISQFELDEIVSTKSSPAAITLFEACASVDSVVLALLAVPPRAVEFIFPVTVHVPDAQIVVMDSMVRANGELTTTL